MMIVHATIKALRVGLLVFLVALTPSWADDDTLAPLRVIDREGQISAYDGVYIYTFKKDGSFSLQTTAMSGKTINGTWTSPDINTPWAMKVRFNVEGRWGWVNGISPLNDIRETTFTMSYLHKRGDDEQAPYGCRMEEGEEKKKP